MTLVLRFMITFTLQEDYREIGVMKAIGIPDGGIKGVYLVKYLALSIVGAAVGLVLSFPFGNMLLRQTVVNIVTKNTRQNAAVSIGCAAAVVLVVTLFCYGSTNRLKKTSVMEAIRDGASGERFQAKSRLSLHGRKRMKPYFYMACNDITGSARQFLVLLVVFFVGIEMILLPLSAVNTLKSEELVSSFSLIPSDAYINGDEEFYVVKDGDIRLREDLKEIREDLEARGYTASAWAEAGYTIPVYGNDPEELYNYYSIRRIGDEPDGKYQLLEGRMPYLADEVMITEKTAKEMGVAVGDNVYYKFPEGDKAFVITGLYQSMINMGDGLRFSSDVDLDGINLSGIFTLQAEVDGLEAEDTCKLLQEIYPEKEVGDARTFMKRMLGNITDQLDVVQFVIAALVLLINSLITALMMKTFIAKERGEIAMLKSIGFANRTIRGIRLTLAAAIVIGAAASKLLIPLVIAPIFGMMGATHMKLIIDPVQTYIIYPALLLLVTGIMAYFAAGEVRRVDCKEINNME